MKFAFVIILILLGASASAQESAPLPPQNACGPTDVRFQIRIGGSHQPEPRIDSGKALVYVIEDQRFKAAKDVTLRIGINGTWVGATRGNSYLFSQVEPGEHHLCASMMPGFLPSGRGVSLFGLTIEAGKVYYFRARTSGGPESAFAGNGWQDTLSVDLDLANGDEGKFLVFSSSSQSFTPEGQ